MANCPSLIVHRWGARNHSMKKVKVGVIGAGGISHAHMEGYQKLPDVQVVAVADVVPGKARAWAEKYDVPDAFEDYRQLLALDEIEGVSVCTYNRAHAQPTIDALRAGKAVLCEKPMAPTLAEAAAMLRAARETGKMLMIGVHSRFSRAPAMVFKISWAVHLDSLGKSYFLGPKGGLQLDPLEIYRDEFGTMVNITPKLPDDRVDRFKEEMQAFTDAIREDRPAPIPAEEVVWTNVIMDGIYRSAAEGREVPVGLHD